MQVKRWAIAVIVTQHFRVRRMKMQVKRWVIAVIVTQHFRVRRMKMQVKRWVIAVIVTQHFIASKMKMLTSGVYPSGYRLRHIGGAHYEILIGKTEK